jgi:UDP-N-acetylmuramoyl-tripeptide--D-alanyl-D-alanine ligase
LDSTYSSNPDGVMAHLDYSKLWPGKKAIIMPCLIELGKSSKDVHYQIGQKIAEVCDLAIITAKDRFKEIKKGALDAGMNPENIIFSENPKIINNLIKNCLTNGDTILLEGRSSQSIIGAIKK